MGQAGSLPGEFSAKAVRETGTTPRPECSLESGLLEWGLCPFPCAVEEAKIMRMRMAAPLLVALASMLGMASTASASPCCGAARYSSCCQPSCDAQCCYPAAQQQSRV